MSTTQKRAGRRLVTTLKQAAVVIGLFGVSVGAGSVSGVVFFWTGTLGEDWSTTSNWDRNALPSSVDEVRFDASYATRTTVSLNTTGYALKVHFQDGSPSFIISGASGALRLPDKGVIRNFGTSDQDLSGLMILQPAKGSVSYNASAGTKLKLPWIRHDNKADGNARQLIYAGTDGVVEFGQVDNYSAARTVSILLDGTLGTLRIFRNGTYTGTAGTALTYRHSGHVYITNVANAGVASPLGLNNAIDFGDASGVCTNGKLTYAGPSGSTDRQFRIYEAGLAIFDVSLPETELTLNTSITQVVGTGGRVMKTGPGTLVLAGAPMTNTFTGATLVDEGVLRLGTEYTLTNSPVTVAAGAGLDLGGFSQNLRGLAGGGTVSNGTLAVGGAIEPGGNGVGTLLLDLASAAPGGTLTVDVAADGTCDVLHATGNLSLDGMSLAASAAAQLDSHKTYKIIECDGTLSGALDGANIPSPWYVYCDRENNSVWLRSEIGTLIRVL